MTPYPGINTANRNGWRCNTLAMPPCINILDLIASDVSEQ